MSYLDRKEEAYELVRKAGHFDACLLCSQHLFRLERFAWKGLKCDLKSHVCWHVVSSGTASIPVLEELMLGKVYGLLYRQDRDYFEAAMVIVGFS